jgi:predicted RNA-binding protein YlxR (DUF448 family)
MQAPMPEAMTKNLPEFDGGPVRTCRGCGARYLKKKLLRFGVGPSGILEVDDGKNLAGRGIYCCPRVECLALLARKKGKLRKDLRVEKIDCSLIEYLVDEYRSDDC